MILKSCISQGESDDPFFSWKVSVWQVKNKIFDIIFSENTADNNCDHIWHFKEYLKELWISREEKNSERWRSSMKAKEITEISVTWQQRSKIYVSYI